MPGLAYGLPAKECLVGGVLVNIKGSVCYDCYALKNMYCFKTVQAAQYRRLESLKSPTWVEDMVTAINGQEWFRWHDSGDLQSIDHLHQIVQVVERTPGTNHWLPTREKKMVREYERTVRRFPLNLTVRVSGAMVDGNIPVGFENTSTVHTTSKEPKGHICPAYQQDGKCGDCRACWSRKVKNVSYPLH